MTTIRHGGPCGLRIEMRAAERREIGHFFVLQRPRPNVTRSEGGVLHPKNEQCGEAAFLYVPHSAVVSRFETALSLRPRGACRERRERPPPKPGGHVTFRRDMMLHVSTPAPWGRSRLHLSLREGSETAAMSGAESTETDL